MNFSFDGQPRSRPNINLSGSSRLRDRDNLIREAFLERKKREEEKRQQQAALTIQSVYRSYAVRKQVKNQLRTVFKDLFSSNAILTQHIPKLFSYFVTFFDDRQDQEELIRFSRFIMENKDSVNQYFSDLMFSLVKFLSLHLNNLKKSQTIVSHSVSLRLIDFFTDYQFENRQKVLVLLIIKHHYLNQLVKYAIEKIPNSVTNENQAHLLLPISQLIYRAICCLTQENQQDLNEKIVNSILTELFVYSNYNQIKCIINIIAAITAEKQQFDSIFCLLKAFETQYGSNKEIQTTKNLAYLDFVLILKCFLRIVIPLIDYLNKDQFITFINVLELIILKILHLDMRLETKSIEDEDDLVVGVDESSNNLEEVFQMLDKKLFTSHTETLFQSLVYSNEIDSTSFYFSFSYLCYFMLKLTRFKIHESFMLRKIAFNKEFLKRLWKQICSMKLEESNNYINCLRILISGNLSKMNLNDLYKIVAPLSTFCSLYNLFLLPILDVEFLEGQAIFTKTELIEISSILKDVCIGIIQLMHPETTASAQINTYLSRQQLAANTNPVDLRLKKQASCFTLLFQSCSLLVQRLYIRDIRAGFCNEDHWLSSHMRLVSLSRLSEILHTHEPTILTNIKFGNASYLFQNENENEILHNLNVSDIRSLTILQELPFTVPFKDRLEILEGFIHQEPRHIFNEPAYKLRIRRDFLYEDAFDNLSLENVENLKNTRLVVEMINQLGLEEAGIDGGGVFREFMLRLLETSFDPNRGLFVLTSDGFLYPNPNIGFLMEDYESHYFFLGRICAKAIQSKILTPLKFAMFFLQKILSKYSDTRLDIDYLASLDPEVYKNLLSLKDLKSNIQDLELNFALNLNEFGETKLIELKPGGKDIYVTNDNKIEYIHLVADYKLNRQIHNQVIAFRNGMSNVINLELLRLFNFNELQFLISGSDELIDVADWQANTLYSGIYSPNNEVIKTFWSVVESFNEEQKRLLLKFVTSRSRTPLFGFKNLIPNFAIHPSGSERLPTASTCLNLLKLPPIEDFDLLKERLICAISSDAGFELS